MFPDAVLSDHPDRLRVLWVDSANPVNTAADTARVLQAMAALDLMVVVDVAYTETAAQADYVLPASSTFEKCEFTLFNFELPTNYFHVRAPVLPPLPGTLPEPEIYGRLARAMGLMPDDAVLDALRAAAGDPARFGAAFAEAAAADKNVGKLAARCCTRPWAAPCPTAPRRLRRCGRPATAWRGCGRRPCARRCRQAPACRGRRDARRRPGAGRTAVPHRRRRPVGRGLLGAHIVVGLHRACRPQGAPGGAADARLAAHARPEDAGPDPAWPFVLSAGQRRLNNANQILRDPGTRASDPDGALYIHPDDLAALGVADRGAVVVETARARMVVRAKATDSMRRGHVALPHGYGQRHPAATARDRWSARRSTG